MVNMQEQINGKQAAGESAAAEAVSAQPKRPDVQRIMQTDTENNRAAIGKEQKERELLREEEEKHRKRQVLPTLFSSLEPSGFIALGAGAFPFQTGLYHCQM